MTQTTYRAVSTVNPALDLIFRSIATITAGLILVQAFMAGQMLFHGNAGIIVTHGWLGNIAFLGTLALVAVAFVGMRQGWGVAPLVLSVVLAALMVAQLGLGYAGRKSAFTASLHIPNGVLLTGVVFALIALAVVRPRLAR
ncbi:MAG: hypothetical protein IT337_13445 [Thermomicrobiales bacterium]|nr:hypothetical protein [Thermomicrobiales bacterium]